MASRRSRSKTRFARRRAHAVLTKGRPGLLTTTDVAVEVAPLARRQEAPITAQVASRGRCPVCRRSERLLKSGVLAKHTAPIDGRRDNCPGAGQEPDTSNGV